MAKMYGDRGREQWDSPDNKTKSMLRGQENRQWKSEAEHELYDERDERHKNGICYNPPGGYGCEWCYDDTDYYDASNLDGIKGVWTDAERLI